MSNMITEERVLELLEKQQAKYEERLKNLQAKASYSVASVDYNPVTKFVYESDGVTQNPAWKKSDAIMDHQLWMEINHPTPDQQKALIGKANDPDREEDCFLGEHLAKYQEMKSQIQDAEQAQNYGLIGSVINSNDFSVIKATIDVSKVLGFQLTNNVLEDAVTVQETPRLAAKYRNWSGFEIMPHVPEGVIVEAKKGSMTETTFQIKKDVGAAAITIEAEILLEGDIFGDHITWIAKKMRKLRNTKIAAAFNTATTSIAGADFGPYTGDRSTNDPGEKLLDVVLALNPKGYAIDSIVSHPQVKREYFQNTFIKGIFGAAPDINNSPRTFRTPGIEGNPTWYSDADITTATILFAYAKEVVKMFEGPKRQTEIGRPDAEVREYYSRDFNDCFIVDQDGIRKVTGVTA